MAIPIASERQIVENALWLIRKGLELGVYYGFKHHDSTPEEAGVKVDKNGRKYTEFRIQRASNLVSNLLFDDAERFDEALAFVKTRELGFDPWENLTIKAYLPHAFCDLSDEE